MLLDAGRIMVVVGCIVDDSLGVVLTFCEVVVVVSGTVVEVVKDDEVALRAVSSRVVNVFGVLVGSTVVAACRVGDASVFTDEVASDDIVVSVADVSADDPPSDAVVSCINVLDEVVCARVVLTDGVSDSLTVVLAACEVAVVVSGTVVEVVGDGDVGTEILVSLLAGVLPVLVGSTLVVPCGVLAVSMAVDAASGVVVVLSGTEVSAEVRASLVVEVVSTVAIVVLELKVSLTTSVLSGVVIAEVSIVLVDGADVVVTDSVVVV